MSGVLAAQPSLAQGPGLAAGGGVAPLPAPPLRLPGAFFTVASFCWLAAAAGITWVAPTVAMGGFTDPRVLAVTHLVTLGWITTTIMGALCQFLPVALGVQIRSMRAAYLALTLYAPGVVVFVAAGLAGEVEWLFPAGLLLGTGLLLFAGDLALTLRRAPRRGLTWYALSLATVFLVATVVFGAGLAGNLRWGFMGAGRLTNLAVHIHVALAGWVGLVMVGVAQKLLPMFLLSRATTEVPARVAVVLLASGALILAVAHHALTPSLIAIAAITMAGGALAFAYQAWLFLRARVKRSLDPGMRLAASGVVVLLVAVGIAPFFVARGAADPSVATAYVLALVGGIAIFVAGFHYKIVPFLIWLHHFGPRAGKGPLPKVADLYDGRLAGIVAALLPIGVIGLVAVTLLGAPGLARPFAVALATGVLILVFQMWKTSLRRP